MHNVALSRFQALYWAFYMCDNTFSQLHMVDAIIFISTCDEEIGLLRSQNLIKITELRCPKTGIWTQFWKIPKSMILSNAYSTYKQVLENIILLWQKKKCL